MKIKGKGFQHCVKFDFHPRKVSIKRESKVCAIYIVVCLLVLEVAEAVVVEMLNSKSFEFRDKVFQNGIFTGCYS